MQLAVRVSNIVMVSQIVTQGCLFDLQTVLDYGQSIQGVAQELAKSLTDHRPIATKTIQSQMSWRETFVKWQEKARVLMSVGVNGKLTFPVKS